MEQEIIMKCGDSKVVLQEFKDNSIDMLCTDAPYGYEFMGKSWDKVLPDPEIWKECFRTLKPGAFMCVMAAPRTDVLWRVSRDLELAGFSLAFSNIEWVYHSGFPKATDISKSIDKRQGAEREVVDTKKQNGRKFKNLPIDETDTRWYEQGFNKSGITEFNITAPATDIAKKYEGSKAGFQPKPAREIIIVGMKPFEEGSYIDKVLNFEALPDNVKMTYPLIQTPKPAKKEKDFGLDNREEQTTGQKGHGIDRYCSICGTSMLKPKDCDCDEPDWITKPKKNSHPTVKPIKLMSYLITLFTRPGDWVLDPFGGSGTTGLACKLLDRNHIYIDFTEEYYDIAQERLEVSKEDLKKLLKEKISNGQQQLF